jgi:hypothetical protein
MLLFVLGSCTSDPKPTPPPPSTQPLELLPGSWEVSDAVRNGKNTAALEGIYFTFTTDEKLTTNFNLSIEERTFPYRMQGDTLIALSDPTQSYLIESLEKEGMVLSTQMEGYLFKLKLISKEDLPEESEEES